MSKTLRELHNECTNLLTGVVEFPRREAELLLMAFFKWDQLYFITHQEDSVDSTDIELQRWIKLRCSNYPLEYLTHEVSFYSKKFYIDEGALIPRPETEILIDEMLKVIPKDKSITLVEVGVGSGIISIMLALLLPNVHIIGLDISDAALKIAAHNIERFCLNDRIELRKSDLLSAVNEQVDVLISNPPYIADDAILELNLSFEPQNALFGGQKGDELIHRLLDQIIERKIPIFGFEMGYDQRLSVQQYLNENAIQSVQFYKDFSGLDRGFIARMNDE